MAHFEATLKKYVTADGLQFIPGVVVLAANRKGEIIADYAAGNDSLATTAQPFTKDTIAEIHSMTKLLTSISAMQCVEHGLLSIDGDISDLFPEWKEAQVLEGWNGDEPILRKAKNPITLRLLLSHTSGLAYSFGNPKMTKWLEYKNIKQNSINHIVLPLMFEPGTDWSYGVGVDWAGRLVEQVSGMSLNDWMKEHIFKPLEMVSSSFRPNEVAKFEKPKAEITTIVDDKYTVGQSIFHGADIKFDRGGGGLYSTADDYIKVLISILRNDGKLLKPEFVEQLFAPQLKDSTSLKAETESSTKGMTLRRYPESTQVDHGLGGMLTADAVPGQRGKNTLEWGGMANLFWWIDRESGICGCQFEQLLPFGHGASIDLVTEFEKHVFAVNAGKS